MAIRYSGKRTLAALVLAFICLNVGGIFCLSYCHQLTMAASVVSDDPHLSEHCRQMKKAAEERNTGDRIDANEASCCMMPVSLFAAPLEKQTRLDRIVMADAVPAAVGFKYPAPALADLDDVATPVYRPPPLDRRVDRLLNCVIRI
ncbi:MAG: hypothetical protein AB7J13_04605 [Pyrinomonadaceae bacterium]